MRGFNRPVPVLVTAAIAAVVCGGAASRAAAQAGDDSPRAVFATHCTAWQAKDYGAYFDTLSERKQRSLLFEIVFQAEMIQGSELNLALKKYYNIKQFTNQPRGDGPPLTREKAIERFIATIKQQKLLAATALAMTEFQRRPGDGVAELRNLNFHKDRAVGTATDTTTSHSITGWKIGWNQNIQTVHKRDVVVSFIKTGGRWKIDSFRARLEPALNWDEAKDISLRGLVLPAPAH